MPLITKLTALRVVKMHKHPDHYIGPDFFKFLLKGMNYLKQEERQFEKIAIHGLLGNTSADYLY